MGDRRRWLVRLVALIVLVAVVVAGRYAVAAGLRLLGKSRVPIEDLPTAIVHRADLKTTLKAAGLVESGNQTEIRCELERLQFRSQGRGNDVGGSSTILSVIPEGSMVRRGDVLCVLDSSDYE